MPEPKCNVATIPQVVILRTLPSKEFNCEGMLIEDSTAVAENSEA